jgi:hypothetical protein
MKSAQVSKTIRFILRRESMASARASSLSAWSFSRVGAFVEGEGGQIDLVLLFGPRGR